MPAPAPRQPHPAEAVRSPGRRRNQALATLAFTSGLVAMSTGLGSAALADEATTGSAAAPAGQSAPADTSAPAATTTDASAAATTTAPAGAADPAASQSPTPATSNGAAPTTEQNASDQKPAEPTGGTPQTSPPATASTSTTKASTSTTKASTSATSSTSAKTSSTSAKASTSAKTSSKSDKCPSGDSAVRHIQFSINGGAWRSPSNGHIPGLSPGDRVAARFEIHPGCSDYKVGLATYESNTSTFGKNTRETLYRSDVGKFNPGQKHQLGPIKNAPCKFQVDLFRGEVLSYITPDHRYGRGRLLAWDIGGAACKEQEHGGGGEKPKPHAQPSKPTHAGGGAKAPRVKAAKAKRKHVRVRAERAQLPRTGSATGAMALTGFAATLVGGSLVVSAYWRRREQEDSF